jgi:transcriptional regulator with XRE-family HTH domain
MDDISKQVGVLLRSARKGRGFSQRELAKQLGIMQDVVSDLEKGARTLRITELLQFSRALGVPPSYFLAIDETEERRALLEACLQKMQAFPEPWLEAVNRFLDQLALLQSTGERLLPGEQQFAIEITVPPVPINLPDIELPGNTVVEIQPESLIKSPVSGKKRRNQNKE